MFLGDRVSVWKDEKVLELDGGVRHGNANALTTEIPRLITMAHAMPCALDHNENILKRPDLKGT